jgi:hypothetical protein
METPLRCLWFIFVIAFSYFVINVMIVEMWITNMLIWITLFYAIYLKHKK